MSAHAHRLLVLPPSHYCERARWGLEHAGVAYEEERLAVGLHVPLTKKLSPSSQLPILVAGDDIVQGSGKILDWAGLTGGSPEIERRFEMRIGVLVRQFVYAATLSDPASGVRACLFDQVPAWQAVIGRVMWPVTRQIMVKAMRARSDLLPGLCDDMAKELDWFEAELASGHLDLTGGFGRTEITAASLLAPLARPAELPLYGRVTLPGPIEDIVAGWRERPGLRFVREVYALHRRGPSSIPRAA